MLVAQLDQPRRDAAERVRRRELHEAAVRVAQPPAQEPDEGHADPRALVEVTAEHRWRDDEHVDRFHGHDAGRPRRAVDERLLAEQRTWPADREHHLVPVCARGYDLDVTVAQDDHAVGHLPLGEDRLTARRAPRRADSLELGALAVVQ